jgi:allantoin racemase
MNILIINPNTTRSMTNKVRIAAEAAAPPHLTVHVATSKNGPASIQGPEDGEAAVPGLLQEIESGIKAGMDGFAIACFDDTGLDECRRMTDKPVIGIGEAAFHASMMLGHSFSVVTTLAVSIPVIEENLTRYGLNTMCKKVRASDVPVLALEEPGSTAEQQISDEIKRALSEDKSSAIVLGCAGMAPLAARLSKHHGVPVIDGVVAATGMLSSLINVQRSYSQIVP